MCEYPQNLYTKMNDKQRAVLLPGAKDQRPLPAAPFVASSFFAGYGGVGPYMILREPRFGPIKRSELGFFPRVVTESKLFGAGLVAGAVGLPFPDGSFEAPPALVYGLVGRGFGRIVEGREVAGPPGGAADA